jgi:hypothetical protein
MNRRTTISIAVLTVAALGAVPSQAAPKKKPAPIKGSYSVTLLPDPSKEATSLAGKDGCSGLSPAAIDHKPFTVPAAGTLTVTLDGLDPAGGAAPAGMDYDLYVTDAEGILDASDGATGHEQTTTVFKKKTAVSIDVCNLDGPPSAEVAYTFTYK